MHLAVLTRGRWALDFPSGPGIKCYALTTGRCWLWVDGKNSPIAMTAGDCVLLPRDLAFRFGSDADVPAQDVMTLISDTQMGAVITLNGGGECSGVGGYFEFIDPQADLLLSLLPPVIPISVITSDNMPCFQGGLRHGTSS
ncbi:cupin domain-containing protein, partial [Acidithiobacillus thiooxidans]|uniref:cupin domain-containing protein n=1 Tax=Acidithiobacillus thiooxidans TaxID=930 RepID=UPI001C07CEE4